MCINYAHRGASEAAPENTLAAFELGLRMGADGIETDIQRTRDGVLVLHHDRELTRVAGVPGQVCEYTYAELSEMDFGGFKNSAYAGERIVTLAEFLRRYAGGDIYLALEIKQEGIEEDVAGAVKALKDISRITITSFSWASVTAVRRIWGDIATGFLTEKTDMEILNRLEAEGIGQICPRADTLGEEDVVYAHARGFSVRAWGVKDDMLMHRALQTGVDGMTVNFPDRLTAALRSRGENQFGKDELNG